MRKNSLIKNILFVQDSSPCIRTIKYATALKSKGIDVHLAHRNKTPDENYGYGNSFFRTLTRLNKSSSKNVKIVNELIDKFKVDILHYHNFPDKLGAKIIAIQIKIPFIYDQHDFMSLKNRFFFSRLSYEKICNEKNDGAVYITENYKSLVASEYRINPNNIVFPNYGSSKLILSQKHFRPKLSMSDENIHLVYVGLITQHKNRVRYLIDIFRKFSEKSFIVHVYPTRKKAYEKYRAIPNLVMHEQLPVSQMINEISQYDIGIALLNNEIPERKKSDEIKYGFWNKMFDYLMAGIPVLTLDFYSDMSVFIKQNGFGISEKTIDAITMDSIKNVDLVKMSENIFKGIKYWTMEENIHKVIDYYQSTLERFNAQT